MTKEDIMKRIEYVKPEVEGLCFLYLSGSRLYGTFNDNSDVDLRGFFMPTVEQLIGLQKCDCLELEGDTKIYSFKKFLDLLLSGDPQCSEFFFLSKDYILENSEIAQGIMKLKPQILSNKIYNRVMGYSNSEWRKAMGQKIVYEKISKSSVEVLGQLWNCFPDIDKKEKDEILKILHNHKNKIVPSVAGLGKKRRDDVQQYGYCRKSAAHAIRLVYMVRKIILSGECEFPLDIKDTLIRIRNGDLPKDEVENIYNSYRKKAERDRSYSILIDSPSSEKVFNFYKKVMLNYFNSLTK